MKPLLISFILLVISTGTAYSQELKLDRWKEFRSKEANVQAVFPGEATLSKKDVDGATGFSVILDAGDRAYIILAIDLPIAGKATEDVLKHAYLAGRDGLLNRFPDSKLVSERSMTIDGKPGYEVEVEAMQHFLKYRFLWSDNRLYEVGTASNYSLKSNSEAQADFAKFLDSFKLYTPN